MSRSGADELFRMVGFITVYCVATAIVLSVGHWFGNLLVRAFHALSDSWLPWAEAVPARVSPYASNSIVIVFAVVIYLVARAISETRKTLETQRRSEAGPKF